MPMFVIATLFAFAISSPSVSAGRMKPRSFTKDGSVVVGDVPFEGRLAKTIEARVAAALEMRGATPRRWDVTVSKEEGSTLGIDVDMGYGTVLPIYTVLEDGLVPDWNFDNPAQAVQVGDRIVEVNGVSGDSWAMVRALMGDPKLDIVFERAAGSMVRF